MAVTLLATKTKRAASNVFSNPSTTSHTVDANTNCLIVILNSSNDSLPGGSDCKWNGVSMTLIGKQVTASGGRTTYILRLLDPDTGTHNLVITNMSGDGVIYLMNFSGTHTTDPIDVHGGVASTGSSISKTLTTTKANTFVIAAITIINGSITEDGSQTELYDDDTTGTAHGHASYKTAASAGDVTMTSAKTNGQDASMYVIAIKPPDPVVVPTVTTQDATDIAKTSVTGNGNITATGGANATRRGFCYKAGTSGDPTTADSVAYDDGDFGTGAFTKSITGLTPGTAYRVRAYAVNSAGTDYGTTVDMTTLPELAQLAGIITLEKESKATVAGIATLEKVAPQTISGTIMLEKVDVLGTLAGSVTLEKADNLEQVAGLVDLEAEKLLTLAGTVDLEKEAFGVLAALALLELETKQTLAGIITFEKENVIDQVAGLITLESENKNTVAGKIELEKEAVETIAGLVETQYEEYGTLAGFADFEKTVVETLAGIIELETENSNALAGMVDLEKEGNETIGGTVELEKEELKNVAGIVELEAESKETLSGIIDLETEDKETIGGIVTIEKVEEDQIAGKIEFEKEELETLAGNAILELENKETLAGEVCLEFGDIKTIAGIATLEKVAEKQIAGIIECQTQGYGTLAGNISAEASGISGIAGTVELEYRYPYRTMATPYSRKNSPYTRFPK